MAVRPTRNRRVPDPAQGRLIVQPARVSGFLLAGILGVGVLTLLSGPRTREPTLHPASAELAGCAARRGALTYGPFKEHYCRVPFADGGKRCTDKSQCQGECIVLGGVSKAQARIQPVSGVCETANVQYGCFTIVEQGAPALTVCAD